MWPSISVNKTGTLWCRGQKDRCHPPLNVFVPINTSLSPNVGFRVVSNNASVCWLYYCAYKRGKLVYGWEINKARCHLCKQRCNLRLSAALVRPCKLCSGWMAPSVWWLDWNRKHRAHNKSRLLWIQGADGSEHLIRDVINWMNYRLPTTWYTHVLVSPHS